MEPYEAELNKKTGSNIPMNIIKDKRELFVKGIFDDEKYSTESVELLDGNDREEYSLMIGEWTNTNEATAPQVNKIFDHFREKLFEIINPPPPPVNKETWPLRLGLGKVSKS